MNANYIIVADDGRVFAGWDQLGTIVIKGINDRYLAYRMSRTVAMRNLDKIQDFLGTHCSVCAC